MLKPYKPLLPGLVVVALGVIYTIFWFAMAGRIEGEIDKWVERQAAHGTEVSWSALKISGYPFRLVASFDQPQILATESENGFAWAGDGLRIIAQTYDIKHILIELLGNQSVSFIDQPQDGSRSPSLVTVDFSGSSLRGSLKVKGGRIENIDTDFRDVVSFIETDGPISLVSDPPETLAIEKLEYHSRLIKVKKADRKEGEPRLERDVMMVANGVVTDLPEDELPLDTLAPKINEILVAFSEEVGGPGALHSGDIGANLPPTPVRKVTIREAHVLWDPVTLRLQGKLERPLKKPRKKNGRPKKFSGHLTLYLKGHEDLIRQKAIEGDVEPGAAVAVGAVLGMLEIATDRNEEGELVIPLDVRDGSVFFGFLPLFRQN